MTAPRPVRTLYKRHWSRCRAWPLNRRCLLCWPGETVGWRPSVALHAWAGCRTSMPQPSLVERTNERGAESGSRAVGQSAALPRAPPRAGRWRWQIAVWRLCVVSAERCHGRPPGNHTHSTHCRTAVPVLRTRSCASQAAAASERQISDEIIARAVLMGRSEIRSYSCTECTAGQQLFDYLFRY